MIHVVGGGLAGCEAALQLAARGHEVRLVEMRPYKVALEVHGPPGEHDLTTRQLALKDAGIDAVIDTPLHPYTVGLLGSVPSANKRGERLYQIEGMTPNMLALPKGCAFGPRCLARGPECEAQPEVRAVEGRNLRCFHPQGQLGVAADTEAGQ